MQNSYTAIINQAISLLSKLSNSEYQKVIKPHFPSSIGAHIRHVIDHFLALQTATSTGHVNYNVRHRHTQVEQVVGQAIEALESINEWLLSLSEDDRKAKVLVTSEIDISNTTSATCESTLERELVFASSHAIHHYALVRIICALQNKQIPEFFGYAPATITHLTRSA